MSTFDGKCPLRSIHGDGELDMGLTFERLMDNAACACQERLLLDSDVVREAIKLNIFDPLMSQLDQLAVVRKALVGLVGADTKEELEQMEAIIRVAPVPDVDRMNTINAIQALLQTK